MLWPLILPFQITTCVLVAVVGILTVSHIPMRWSRLKTFVITSSVAVFLFVPSCTGIMFVVDAIRFGHFHYERFGDIRDARFQRYLPESATDIQMRKRFGGNGYAAHYQISADEFASYLDDLWEKYGDHSAVQRGGFIDDGETVSPEMFDMRFEGLGWECPSSAIAYRSPSESDGGGASYYFDAEAGLMYQHTGFW